MTSTATHYESPFNDFTWKTQTSQQLCHIVMSRVYYKCLLIMNFLIIARLIWRRAIVIVTSLFEIFAKPRMSSWTSCGPRLPRQPTTDVPNSVPNVSTLPLSTVTVPFNIHNVGRVTLRIKLQLVRGVFHHGRLLAFLVCHRQKCNRQPCLTLHM